MRLPFILRIITSLCLTTSLALAISLARPGCQENCGNVTIPYPFGIDSKCRANDSFHVICNNSFIPPRLFLSSINMEVLDIDLEGTVTIKNPVTPMNCSDVPETRYLVKSLEGTPFTISDLYNSLVVLGCQNSVWLRAYATETTVGGCMALCDPNSTDTSCNGVNCCRIMIPPQPQVLKYTYQGIRASGNNRSCGYAFLAGDVHNFSFNFKPYEMYEGIHNDLLNPYDHEFRSAPLVLEWNLYISCRDIRIRRRYNPYVYEAMAEAHCICRYGYEGNPYLHEGCKDIDECSNNATPNPCGARDCINLEGGYRCRSRHAIIRTRVKITSISIGSGLGALILLFGAWMSSKAIRKRIKANRKQKFFKRNGGLLLQQQLSSSDNGLEKSKLFSSKELAQATDRYNENRILGCGGQGTVYKGMLTDGRIVAVKKSKRVDEGDLEVFINEVVILSQINHRNVVKLLGCCLETEVPLLIYEFIPNGTLFQHIHDPNEEFPLSWEMRVRIAREIAAALSYLHSAASAPIYHRDIKSTNILLDDKYRAKVADFGTSRSVSIDQTHLTTRVLGTFGYLDPEYFQSSQYTEKSDVYSFGVVMVELLTGEKAISSIRSAEAGRSLATYFLQSMEENCLFDILDARVLKEGKREEILGIAQVARRCLHLNGKRRPTMKEVVVELEGLQMLQEGSSFQQNEDEKKEYHSIEVYDFSSISESMHLDSITGLSPEDDCPLLDES